MIDGFATIERMAHSTDGRTEIAVIVGNRFGEERLVFVLLDELVDEAKLCEGSIDAERLSTLELLANATKAYISACASFAYSPCSLAALEKKLRIKGFDGEARDVAIELVRRKGFVDEDMLSKRRAELLVEKLWGRSRIIMQLRADGFSKTAVAAAYEYLDTVDFEEICYELIKKKKLLMPFDRREIDRAYASLARYGHSSSDIRAAFARISGEYDE